MTRAGKSGTGKTGTGKTGAGKTGAGKPGGSGPRKPGGGGQRGLHERVKTARKRTVSSTRWLERQLNDP